ncbi:MAG: zinc ribbon domain-containing protein [Actinobacteria bacterium]|nr:MAG: zinc ribbon domain-containing protein [Actinomycetota bacterium]
MLPRARRRGRARRRRVETGAAASFSRTVPIYEYRCPNGHVFELFKRMDDPPPEECEICGASPVELVLYPVAIHYKGSGFYSTEYGKGGKRKAGATESGSSDSGGEKKSDSSPTTSEPKKAAEA